MNPSPDTCPFCYLILGKQTPGIHSINLEIEVTAKFCDEHHNRLDILVFNKLAKRKLKEADEQV